MHFLGIALILGLLAGVWAQINVIRPQCDSSEAEEAALVAQDFLNAQHTHGYKYALNRIEDIKIYTKPDGDNTYVLEVELLETDCHVLDPTPLANCTVRPKILTAIEADCDVVLKKVGGALTVTAFKCKTDESTEDMCMGCATLLPLNDTTALDFVHASLATFNNLTVDGKYAVMEIGRMSSQVVSGGPIYFAEYVVVEAKCTDDACVPLHDATAARGICAAKGLSSDHIVDCTMFSTLMPVDANITVADANSTVADANSTVANVNNTAAPAMPSVVHVHTGSRSPKHGLRHHKLTALHDPQLSGFLSAESAESAEVVPVVARATRVAAADPAAGAGTESAEVVPVVPTVPAAGSAAAGAAAADPAAGAGAAAADPAAGAGAAAADPAAGAGAVALAPAAAGTGAAAGAGAFAPAPAPAADPAAGAGAAANPGAGTESAEVVPVAPTVAGAGAVAANPGAGAGTESAEVVPVAPTVAGAGAAAADPGAGARTESAEVVPVAPAVAGAGAAAADPAAGTGAAAGAGAVAPAPAAAADPAAGTGAASDSSTSAEVPVVVKRDVPDAPTSLVVDTLTTQTDPIALMPVCPGRVRFF